MTEWQDLGKELAKKLTPILAFGVLVIIVVALLGAYIPAAYQTLIYIVVIGAMVIYAVIAWIQLKGSGKTIGDEPVANTEGKPEPPAKSTEEPKPAAPVPPIDARQARENYLRAVAADCRPLRLGGLSTDAADPNQRQMRLERVYQSLDTTAQVEPEERKKHGKTDLSSLSREDSRPLSALEALSTNKDRHIVLLGYPGTGKSTFARFLALAMAELELDRRQAIQERLESWSAGILMPVILSLGRLAESLPANLEKGDASIIENYLQQVTAEDTRMAAFTPFLLESLKSEDALVLFDGLDEVADLKLRPVIIQAIDDFVRVYQRRTESRFLVTCRTLSYHQDPNWQLPGWMEYELALFTPGKIEEFVDAWYDELSEIMPARVNDYNDKRNELKSALQPDDRRRLHEIAPYPIILTMMAIVHTHGNKLPDSRAQVYEECVKLLLDRWQVERPVKGKSEKSEKFSILDALGVAEITLYRALWEVAYKTYLAYQRKEDGEQDRSQLLVTEDDLCGVLQHHFQDLDKVKIFLDYCQSSNGLLMYQGMMAPPDSPPDTPKQKVYAYPHQTFQEYLTARHLYMLPDFAAKAHELFLQDDRWRVVVMFLGEHICFGAGKDFEMEKLLAEFSPDYLHEPISASRSKDLWLAGDLLVLYRRAFPSPPARAESHTMRNLCSVVSQTILQPRQRAAAADTLDALGYLPPDLPAFIHVQQDGLDFWIGKYPVTNAQYERFLQPDNFKDPRLWLDFPKLKPDDLKATETWGEEGWQWLQRKELDDTLQGKVLLPRFWRDPRFGIARRGAPLVGVTWWEAMAYCRWLQQHWSEQEEGRLSGNPPAQHVRLPLEAEWIAAAGGKGDEKESRYPWSTAAQRYAALEEVLQRANVDQSGINRTTPVGMYPQGASQPWKVMDMAGNVWEWQLNLYQPDKNWLALRGGSWLFSAVSARVARRHWYGPVDSWYYAGGFRVVSVPS